MSFLPPVYAHTFTHTTHTSVPPNLTPSATHLGQPFIAVVTGAGKGLGYHISLAYAAAGCTGLSISSRTASDLDALEHEIKKVNPKTEVLKTICDVQSDASVSNLVTSVREKWANRVDAVIANAGTVSNYITPPPPSSSTQSNLPVGLIDDTDWERVLSINLLGTWRIARAFMPLLVATKDGAQTLICSTSMAAMSSSSENVPVAYNISKFALNRLMEHVANDHGGEGVQAFALHPGAVITPQTQNHQGEIWDAVLADDVGLAGAMCVWLSKEKREWLSGRYVIANWDVDELEGMKDEIVEGDKLKFSLRV